MITPFIPKFVFSLAAEATYLLRTLFSGVSGPWSDAQVLDTTAEGVTDGSRTVVDTGAGSLTVASNKQAVTGSGTNNETGIIEASVTREKGHTYQHKFTVPSGGNSYIGFHTSAALSTQISGVRITGTNVYAVIGATQILVGTVTVGQEYTITEVLDTAGFILYIKGGTEYTDDTILYIDDTDSTATVHPQNQTVAAIQTLTDDYLIPETLYPELVTPQFQQLFANADGSGATGGTTEDPTSKNNIVISSDALRGVAVPDARFDVSCEVVHTLNTALSNGCVIVVTMNINDQSNPTCYNIIEVKDSLGERICRFWFYYSTPVEIPTWYLNFYDRTNLVANLITSPTSNPSSGDKVFKLYINLNTKKASLFADGVPISSNIDIDISDGGGMTSTDIAKVISKINPHPVPSSYDTSDMTQKNLRIYPLTREITI